MVEVTCIDEVNGQFFLVVTAAGVTIRTPINEALANFLLSLGVPRCT
ncbi:DUF3956 domain-containing protein [Brevibacillus sp. 7WMA2]|nr:MULTISPECIES: DUF3956 family protein [Brevibacillus]AYK08667.1 DUF3956 domain-containing protein [Brevibacillus laterosporus]ERM16555.1 hypothetical protein P615_23350 [Brevibacillus laterosporus PE36]MBA4535385.1 DUF3956 family protein [Brevibacillus halotolerans]MCR8962928.1 DUF3956 family protein [Brevibacillus laterosporus]MCR8997125.1 DUF3956 family protein [Brevibacillus laterosporus]